MIAMALWSRRNQCQVWNSLVGKLSDGSLFHIPDTKANAAAFGRSSNHYGPGGYPQVKCVLPAECGSHAVVGLEMDRYDVSEVHGAYRLLSQVGPDTWVLVDAGLISGALIEQVRARRSWER